ncbi:MAG: hypothetical protein ACK502_07080 [Alphaproteobacteria bacterium]
MMANAPNNTCWICGADSLTGEHKIKRSDLRDVFGNVTQADALYFHDNKRKNKPIGSLNAKLLKLSSICAYCNNTRTQPYDNAWENLSGALRKLNPAIESGRVVRANRIFRHDTAREMLNVHLHFVKWFGCRIVEGNIPIDISAFAASIITGKAHPNLYLKFGMGFSLNGKPMAGMSDVEVAERIADGQCAFATCFYNVSDFAVNVMFALDGEKRNGLIGAWHPRLGTNKLIISDF